MLALSSFFLLLSIAWLSLLMQLLIKTWNNFIELVFWPCSLLNGNKSCDMWIKISCYFVFKEWIATESDIHKRVIMSVPWMYLHLPFAPTALIEDSVTSPLILTTVKWISSFPSFAWVTAAKGALRLPIKESSFEPKTKRFLTESLLRRPKY